MTINGNPAGDRIDPKIKNAARALAEEGVVFSEISARLGVKITTLSKWSARGKWKTPKRVELITNRHLQSTVDPGLLTLTLSECEGLGGRVRETPKDEEKDDPTVSFCPPPESKDGQSGDFCPSSVQSEVGRTGMGEANTHIPTISVPICPTSPVPVVKNSQLSCPSPVHVVKNSQPVTDSPYGQPLTPRFDNSLPAMMGVENALPSSFDGFKQTLRSADQAARAADFRSAVYRENMTAAMENLSRYVLQLSIERPNLAIMVMPHVAKIDAIASKRFKLDEQGKESATSDSLKLVSSGLEDGADCLFVE